MTIKIQYQITTRLRRGVTLRRAILRALLSRFVVLLALAVAAYVFRGARGLIPVRTGRLKGAFRIRVPYPNVISFEYEPHAAYAAVVRSVGYPPGRLLPAQEKLIHRRLNAAVRWAGGRATREVIG